MPYTAPKPDLDGFNCPLCQAYAHQEWCKAGYRTSGGTHFMENVSFAFCSKCKNYTLWVDDKMIFPLVNGAPPPHQDLPKEVKDIYEEARSIVSLSGKASAALLRLSIETLTNDILNESKGKNLNDNIGKMVKNGLDEKIQKSLDVLRIIGNNSIHPGQIDFEDSYNTAISLFELVNIIADSMIRQPKKIDEFYNSLPKDKLEGIDNRNGRS